VSQIEETISTLNFYHPVPYYGEKAGLGGGGGAVPISQGQFSVTAKVYVVYELQP
jgi:uncharacterized protein YggE